MVRVARLELDKVEVMDYDQDVDDWIARAVQSADEATQARELIADAIGTWKFGGKWSGDGLAR